MDAKRIVPIFFLGIFIFSVGFVSAGEVDEHAPIGVMADHMHKKGEWMASYRYMRMEMPKNYTGTKELTVGEVHKDYMLSPVFMSMEMHMLGMMFGVSDNLTAMAMVPYIVKDMDHRRRSDDGNFRARTQGIGDVKVSGMLSLKELVDLPMHLNLGVSVPTGSINQRDDTILGADQALPYPMQLGSGTFAVLPGMTYFDKRDRWNWGFQQASTIQIGTNEQKYQLGDVHELTTWFGYKWQDWISSSLRLKFRKWGNINGEDPRLNSGMVPTADAKKRAGQRLDLFLGFNLLGTGGLFHDHRLAVEIGYPVYQTLEGPQLGAGFQGTFGWQKAW